MIDIDPKKVWFAGELCLNEQPADKVSQFFNAWGDCVKKDDVICILGNIAEKEKGPWMARIKDMPGRKVLVLGSHEKKKIQWYYSFGVDMVVMFGNAITLRHALGNILISSIPCFESLMASVDNDKYMGVSKRLAKIFGNSSSILNIHGYTRGRSVPNGKSFDASLEAINYCPVLLDQIIGLAFKGE
jgi:calcineurin-like phosphoesterase family protein